MDGSNAWRSAKWRTDMVELKAVNSAVLDSTAQMLAVWRKMAPVEPILKADFLIRSLVGPNINMDSPISIT